MYVFLNISITNTQTSSIFAISIPYSSLAWTKFVAMEMTLTLTVFVAVHTVLTETSLKPLLSQVEPPRLQTLLYDWSLGVQAHQKPLEYSTIKSTSGLHLPAFHSHKIILHKIFNLQLPFLSSLIKVDIVLPKTYNFFSITLIKYILHFSYLTLKHIMD